MGIDLGALLRNASTGIAAYQGGKREADAAQQAMLAKLFAQRLQERQQAETERRNRALEQIQLERRPKALQTVFTDQGLMTFDPESGVLAPVAPAGGVPPHRPETPRPPERPIAVAPGGTLLDPKTMQPVYHAPERPTKERTIPASIATKIAGNERQVTVIDDALKQLQRYPEGVGMKNLVPDILMQRLDPRGVAVRASVADVGSLQIHDRSGAAVTVSEAPRLKPFVPLPTDTPEAVKKKLQRLKDLLEQETEGLRSGAAEPDTPEAGVNQPKPAPTRSGYRPGNRWAKP